MVISLKSWLYSVLDHISSSIKLANQGFSDALHPKVI